MTWRQFSLVLALGAGVAACDKIPFLGGKKGADSTATVADTAAPADTQAMTQAAPPPPAPTRAQTVQRQVPLTDEPWTPVDTGTVEPGMSRDQVIAVWGVPVAERNADGRTYLYFRNGCEVTCGTFDVVFLANGGVVDVIARGQGHHYAGTSSSPQGRKPEPTPPGSGTMTMPATDSTTSSTSR